VPNNRGGFATAEGIEGSLCDANARRSRRESAPAVENNGTLPRYAIGRENILPPWVSVNDELPGLVKDKVREGEKASIYSLFFPR
jgi:hypothetical protein